MVIAKLEIHGAFGRHKAERVNSCQELILVTSEPILHILDHIPKFCREMCLRSLKRNTLRISPVTVNIPRLQCPERTHTRAAMFLFCFGSRLVGDTWAGDYQCSWAYISVKWNR